MVKSVKTKQNVILVVDADKSRANNLSSRLRTTDYTTELTSSGFHTIHLIEKSLSANKQYIMVIISGDSTDMPGREVLNLIRNVYPKGTLPILYMAENNDAEQILEVIQEGANDYIVATDNFQKVFNKITKLHPLKNKKKKAV